MLENIVIEALQPDFLSPAFLTPPLPLHCVTGAGLRDYLYVKDGVLYAAPGITHVLSKTATVAEQEGILSWRENVGAAYADRYTQERCNFGTLMHGETCKYDKDRCYDFDAVKDTVLMFQVSHPLPFSVNLDAWEREIKEDVAAWIYWQQRVQAETLATELPLFSRSLRVASRLDWLGYLTIGEERYYVSGTKAGQPKGNTRRVLAIVDKKSSRKNHTDRTRPLQLLAYERMLKENFPQFQDEPIYLFNWSPNQFRTTPKYTFTPHFLLPRSIEMDAAKKAKAESSLLKRIDTFYEENSLNRNVMHISGMYRAGQDVTTHIQHTTILHQLAEKHGARLDDAILVPDEEEETT